MRRTLASIGVVSLGVLSMGLLPHTAQPKPPAASVPTAKKVVTTSPPMPPAPPVPAAAVPVAPPVANPLEQARQGVVVIERQGKPLALGVVLEGDGRVLTALSTLGNGNFVSARYADGLVAPLKLTFSDRGWDLALLVATKPAPPAKPAAAGVGAAAGAQVPVPASPPVAPTRQPGLRAARAPSFVSLQTFNLAPPTTIAAGPATLKLSPGLLGADAVSLAGAYELGSKPAFVGGPVLNADAEVVALVARACPATSTAGCVPAPYGAPVAAIKQFLQRVPAAATWLGVEAASDDARGVRGVRITSVVPGSPAAAAGLRPGSDALQADLVVAVDGAPVSTPAELNEAVRARTPGDSVELLLYGLGRYRHVAVKPRPAPELSAPPYVVPRPGRPRLPNPYR